jgi:hypothetical protein
LKFLENVFLPLRARRTRRIRINGSMVQIFGKPVSL